MPVLLGMGCANCQSRSLKGVAPFWFRWRDGPILVELLFEVAFLLILISRDPNAFSCWVLADNTVERL